MFEKLLTWIRGVLNRMTSLPALKQVLNQDVAISKAMLDALDTWSKMYVNQAEWLNDDVHSLSLPAAIASEIARSVMIEMKVEFTGSARAEWLQQQFEELSDGLREKVERGLAYGGIIMKPYVDNDRVVIDFVTPGDFYPLAFDSRGQISSAVFIEKKTIGNAFYTRLEIHSLTDSGIEIQNLVFKSSSSESLGSEVSLESVPEWAEYLPGATITGVDRLLLAYFRYPMANNIDPKSPLGVSCFSRATELIQDADEQWSRFLWEFESGERALYVDTLAFQIDEDGRPILPNRKLYKTLNTNSSDTDLFKEWSPNLREEQLLNGLDAILKKIEFTCGLAYGTLSDPATVDKTATEIAVARQRTYSTIVDTQSSLRQALEDLFWAIDNWATMYSLAPKGPYEVAFDFDDSIVVDRDLQFQQDMRLVTAGLMSKVEFRMRNFHESEEVARQKIADAQAEVAAQVEVQSQFLGA